MNKNLKGNELKQIHEIFWELPLFKNIYLSMQVQNLSLVDQYLEDLEINLLNEYIELERTPVNSAMFVSAISQLWIFALYELLRTWRQQVKELIKYGDELSKLTGENRKKKNNRTKTLIIESILNNSYKRS